jgi:hypothetical protein
MSAINSSEVLNRVLAVHNRSLPRYLRDAAPWLKRGAETAVETLEQIARDHEQVVDRMGELLIERSQSIDLGEYPMVFTAYHDVALDFLLPILIDRQQRTVAYLEQCAAQLAGDAMAKALVEETVGMAKAHLDMLRELTQPASLRLAELPAGGTSAQGNGNGDGHGATTPVAHAHH